MHLVHSLNVNQGDKSLYSSPYFSLLQHPPPAVFLAPHCSVYGKYVMKLQFINRNLWILLKREDEIAVLRMLASCLSEGAGTNILLEARASRSNRFRELSCFTCNVEAMFETNPSTLSLLGIVDIRFGLQS